MTTKFLTQSLLIFVLLLVACSEHAEPEQKLNKQKLTQTQSNSVRLANGDVFDGTEGAPIELKLAVEWTHRWQTENPEGTKAYFYGRETLQAILAQEGSVGIRFYHGIDEKGNRQLVLVGVNTKGEDLLPNENYRISSNGYNVFDCSAPCPTVCATESELN